MKLDLLYLPVVREREEASVRSFYVSEFFHCMHAWYLRPIFLLLRAMIPPTIHLVFRMYLTNTEEPSVLARIIHLFIFRCSMVCSSLDAFERRSTH
jgi:hypothetical protein